MIDWSQPVVVLTGAGISAESGIPTFRGAGSLSPANIRQVFGRPYRATDLATPQAFRRDPTLVWEFYNWRREMMADCQPNPAHLILVEMEQTLPDFTLITQNIDGLHQRAGSQNILALHGDIWHVRCTECAHRGQDHRVPLRNLPPQCPFCDGLLRPDVVWFGEALPYEILETAFTASARAALILVIGTSALVQPAASLPLAAKENGATLIEVNPRETPLSPYADEILRGPASKLLPNWWTRHQPR